MKHKLPEEVMPELYLTREEELSVEKEANDMLRDALASYRAFVAANRVLPREKWKRVKSKEGFDVFRSRSKSAAVGKSDCSASKSSSSFSQLRSLQASSSSGSSGTPASMPEIERSNPSDSSGSMTASQVSSTATSATAAMAQFPKVVLTGFAPGTVEDAAFGVIASTEAIWRLRSAYLNDHHRDCKILATLKRPCKDDPFRFLGIKWAARKLPSFVQQRDVVYLENVGVVYDAEGKIEMVYNLMHSIELPGIPELSQYDILRMKLSLCYIMRPHDDKSIEYYCRAFSIPSGDVPSNIAVMIYADALLSTINLIDCSHMKKLMWLMQQRRKLRVQNDATATTISQNADTVTHCQGCLRGLKLFGGLNRPVSRCQCCKRIVCGKCSSERKLVLDVANDGAVTQKPLAFCVQCVVEARVLPAVKIAVATAIS